MKKFTTLTGVAAPMPLINIDTDMILPKQYLKTIERTGLGKHAFEDIRYNPDGTEKEDFIFNQPAYRNANIIIAGDNFGCGSSREHAPWALLDMGVQCIISTSIGDIFFSNCFKNGMLPITLDDKTVKELMEKSERGANAVFTVDLENQQIIDPDGEIIPFDIEPFRKHCLLNGLDDIGLTLQSEDKIKQYEEKIYAERPWVFNASTKEF